MNYPFFWNHKGSLQKVKLCCFHLINIFYPHKMWYLHYGKLLVIIVNDSYLCSILCFCPQCALSQRDEWHSSLIEVLKFQQFSISKFYFWVTVSIIRSYWQNFSFKHHQVPQHMMPQHPYTWLYDRTNSQSSPSWWDTLHKYFHTSILFIPNNSPMWNPRAMCPSPLPAPGQFPTTI